MADLCKSMREHADDAMLQQANRDAILRKPKGHDFDYSRQKVDGQVIRQMSHIGGGAQGRCCTDRRVRHAVTNTFSEEA